MRNRVATFWHEDYDFTRFAFNASNFVENLPSTVAHMREREAWPKWKIAIDEEMDALSRNQT